MASVNSSQLKIFSWPMGKMEHQEELINLSMTSRYNAIISWRGRSGLEPWSARPCSFTNVAGILTLNKILSKWKCQFARYVHVDEFSWHPINFYIPHISSASKLSSLSDATAVLLSFLEHMQPDGMESEADSYTLAFLIWMMAPYD